MAGVDDSLFDMDGDQRASMFETWHGTVSDAAMHAGGSVLRNTLQVELVLATDPANM
jgi:hypothetical protein